MATSARVLRGSGPVETTHPQTSESTSRTPVRQNRLQVARPLADGPSGGIGRLPGPARSLEAARRVENVGRFVVVVGQQVDPCEPATARVRNDGVEEQCADVVAPSLGHHEDQVQIAQAGYEIAGSLNVPVTWLPSCQ